eukprot:1163889-Prymnesium_polylepis.1
MRQLVWVCGGGGPRVGGPPGPVGLPYRFQRRTGGLHGMRGLGFCRLGLCRCMAPGGRSGSRGCVPMHLYGCLA